MSVEWVQQLLRGITRRPQGLPIFLPCWRNTLTSCQLQVKIFYYKNYLAIFFLKLTNFDKSSVPTTGTSGVDETANTKSPAKMKGRDVWQQLGISDSDLLEYNEKFRLWLSSTVFQPLVAEIQRINESLTAHGLADARIGKHNNQTGNWILYF